MFRGNRSPEPSDVATEITNYFALIDDADHRKAVGREFPGSSVMAAIDGDTEAKADEYVRSIFE
jgi:hypothetical protein